MTSYMAQIVNVILVFISTLAMNFAVEFFTADSGSIRKGEIISISDKLFKPIEIENYNSGMIDDIKISIPLGLDLKEIISSKPIQISAIASTASSEKFNVVNISSVIGSGVTRILVPLKDENAGCCQVLNAKELKFSIKSDSDVVNPIKSAFLKGMQVAAIYSLFILALALWVNSKAKELKQDLKEITENLEATKEDSSKMSDKLREDLIEIKKIYQRQRVFLLRRISDYGKELEFWRNTIRKILVGNACDKNSTEQILREISKAIGTLSTHGNTEKEYEDFEVLYNVISSIHESSEPKV